MLYKSAQMRKADFFEHFARLVEVFANITPVCVRAVTYLAAAQLVISFDNISCFNPFLITLHLAAVSDLNASKDCSALKY